jgi:hypothetical protein
MPAAPPHLVCTAARPAAVAPFTAAWKNETAVLLARGIVMDSAPDRLPILADALEEAGCDDPLVLRHCRECVRHFPHCWVIAEVLDRPTAVELPPVARMTDAEVRREVERVTGRPVQVPDDAEWDSDIPMRLRMRQAVPVLVMAGFLGLAVYVFVVHTLGDPQRPKPPRNTFPTYLAPAVAPPR